MANEDLVGATSSGALSTIPDVVAARREAFCQYYVSNGGNATRAYLRAGYSKEDANRAATLLLRQKDIATRVGQLKFARSKEGLKIENMLKQINAIATFDPRKLFDESGERIPFDQLDEDTALALKNIDGEAWSKERALDMAMKNLGGYEKDNSQKGECLAIQVIVEN